MIKKVGKKWYLYTKDGTKVLGRHATKTSAQKQEVAINISKTKVAGHRISRKKA